MDTDGEFEGSLFPVFVTADIPNDTINDIFQRCTDFTASEEVDALEALVLVEAIEGFNPVEPTSIPIPSSYKASASPFLGKDVAALQKIFEDKIAPGDEEEETPKAANVFVVLDERTARDKTVLLVSLESPELDDDDDEEGEGANEHDTVVHTARCEPEIAAIMAMGPEMGIMSLTEGREDAKGPDGVYVLTVERYHRTMEEDDDLDDEDLEDDEEEDDA